MITEREAYDMYDDMLNECNDEVCIGDLIYQPSHVLMNVDPIAYDCGFNDYVDSLIEDGEVVEGFNDDDEEE